VIYLIINDRPRLTGNQVHDGRHYQSRGTHYNRVDQQRGGVFSLEMVLWAALDIVAKRLVYESQSKAFISQDVFIADLPITTSAMTETRRVNAEPL
jgi:hypothetical protein